MIIIKFKTLLIGCILVLSIIICTTSFVIAYNMIPSWSTQKSSIESPMIAIIIDDFGQSRSGVTSMLKLDVPLTAAIMPFMQFTKSDAELARQNGKEVIVHLPMQASKNSPLSWYGPNPILIGYNSEKSNEIAKLAIEDVPYAVGMNVHCGGKSTTYKEIVSGVISACKEKNIYFVDSRTGSKSVCKEVSAELNVDFLDANVFLEHNQKNKSHVKNQLKKAAKIAKKKGYAVVIGHVGPEGGMITVDGISEMLDYFEEEGIQLVTISELLNSI